MTKRTTTALAFSAGLLIGARSRRRQNHPSVLTAPTTAPSESSSTLMVARRWSTKAWALGTLGTEWVRGTVAERFGRAGTDAIIIDITEELASTFSQRHLASR